MGLFDSPYEREAPGASSEDMASYADLIRRTMNLQNPLGDIKGMGDVTRKFGLQPFNLGAYKKNVGNQFGVAKRNLATNLDRTRSAISDRLGSSVTPEYAFAGAEGEFAQASGNLAGAEAGAQLAGLDKEQQYGMQNANFLRQIFGDQTGFEFNKLGAQGNAMQMKSAALQRWLQSLSKNSTFDDIAAIGGLVSKFLPIPGMGGGGVSAVNDSSFTGPI